MRYFTSYILIGCFLFLTATLTAQSKIGFVMPYGEKSVKFPFELYSNLIAIPVTINNTITLKFILDSGAESAILTEKIFGDLINLNYVRTIHVAGPGIQDSVSAFVASNISMSLPGGITARGINMLVLDKDYLELKKNLGDDIYGIIGYDIFSRFVIEIDYEAMVITFHDPRAYRPRNSYTRFDLELEQTKPFLRSMIFQEEKIDTVKMLIDTGASHALLLDVNSTDEISLPKKVIEVRLGQGLGGEIPGKLGRMPSFCLGEYCFDDVLTSIPLEGAYMKAIKRGSRHGTIGGDILRRFDVVFDYTYQHLYLKKNGHYRDAFEFDMSGMTLVAEGKQTDTLMVKEVREKTPAKRANIRPGDIILKINGSLFRDTALSEIHALLRKRDGKKIKMVILRGDRKIKKKIRLKRMI